MSKRPDVLDDSQWAPLLATELNWRYQTVPQKHLGGRVVANATGKALGGRTAINAGKYKPKKGYFGMYELTPIKGAWTRGDRQNYDHWGEIVNDNRWSYDEFLPYFCEIEKFHTPHGDPNIHGFDGRFRWFRRICEDILFVSRSKLPGQPREFLSLRI